MHFALPHWEFRISFARFGIANVMESPMRRMFLRTTPPLPDPQPDPQPDPEEEPGSEPDLVPPLMPEPEPMPM
ncbi:MAG TPA: hypothetical protein VD837_00505 [Terriglobales bacterium]|nr:hypothetical protein [Terriglobales bacterium]